MTTQTAGDHDSKTKQQFVNIQVVTGSGNYPSSGFQHYNSHELLSTVLHQAQQRLHLQNTAGWVVKTDNDRVLNPSLTIAENNLHDQSQIFWAPTESGGGSADASGDL
jgi:hypothetical protein